MCLQIPGRVIEVKGRKAIIDYDIEKREAVIADVKCKKDDWVLVVGQFVVDKVSPKTGRTALNHWKKTRSG